MTGYWETPKVFAVKHKDLNVRMNSRSGGVFTALSDSVLNCGGIVYGCALNEKFDAVHIRADNKKTRDAMRGSKYIQSHLQDTFKNVKQDLEAGRTVMFSGTPCQIAGLKGFLKDDYEQLILIDILCHGVPSEKVWKRYLAWQENKNGECTAVDFRNKKDFGWADHVESLSFGDKTIHSKVFATIFYGHNALRPCCYRCPFRSLSRVGDISIADYWEIDRAYPGFNDNKGVSLVFVNNDKGNSYFESVKDTIEWKETRLEDSTRPSMIHPFARPETRDQFWLDFYSQTFSDVAKKYGGYGLYSKTKKKVRRLASKVKQQFS